MRPTREQIHHGTDQIAKGEQLDARYRDHALGGDAQGSRECHVQPDVLLIYVLNETHVVLVRLGSHSELFDKSLRDTIKAAKKRAALMLEDVKRLQKAAPKKHPPLR